MRVRIDTGRQPEQDVLHNPACLCEIVEQSELVEAVHHDPAAAYVERVLQFVRRLVVTVEIDSAQVDTRGDRHRQLTARDDIESETLFIHYPGDTGVHERLGSIQHLAVSVSIPEAIDEIAAHAAQGNLVEDQQRRTEFTGQIDRVAPADGQMVLRVDVGREREEGSVVEGHLKWRSRVSSRRYSGVRIEAGRSIRTVSHTALRA